MRTTTTSNRNRNLVSAVLLNYISYDQTIQCVTDLLAQEYSALDIVIVDNRSPNGAFKHLANAFRSEDRVSLIETPENLGYARGNNFGCEWRLSKGSVDYLLIANGDIRIPSRTALQELVDLANAIDDLGGVGPRVINTKGFIQGPYSRPNIVLRSLRYMFPVLPYIQNLWGLRWQNRDIMVRPCYAIVGAFMLLHAPTFVRTGMFDPRTFLGADEYILAERFLTVGRRFYYLPSVSVEHHHGGSVLGSTGRDTLGAYKSGVESMAYYFENYQKASPLGIRLYVLASVLYGRTLFPLRKHFM